MSSKRIARSPTIREIKTTINNRKQITRSICLIHSNYSINEFHQFVFDMCIYIYIYIYINTIVAIFYPFRQFSEINISLLSLHTQPNTAPNLFKRGVEYGKHENESPGQPPPPAAPEEDGGRPAVGGLCKINSVGYTFLSRQGKILPC